MLDYIGAEIYVDSEGRRFVDETATTSKIAKAIADSDAYSIVGGGDSLSAIKMAKVENKIDLISTGGGATLKFIEQGSLPCIDVIQDKIVLKR